MSIKNKEISKKLENELRSVSFSQASQPVHDPPPVDTEAPEPIAPTEVQATPFSLNKRIVTLEYLDKFEQATVTATQYESLKEFSHIISNVSLVLLSVSVIGYLVFYFINPDAMSLISLLLLSLEAFTLLSFTLYSTSKASSLKQIRDMAASDFSTCSNTIGNPREESYIPAYAPTLPDVANL